MPYACDRSEGCYRTERYISGLFEPLAYWQSVGLKRPYVFAQLPIRAPFPRTARYLCHLKHRKRHCALSGSSPSHATHLISLRLSAFSANLLICLRSTCPTGLFTTYMHAPMLITESEYQRPGNKRGDGPHDVMSCS